MRQTQLVIAELQRLNPGLACIVEIIRTQGDEQPDVEASQLEGQGAFVRRIEAALRAGQVDVAVHSAKDMPSEPTPGLTIAAYPPREDPRDALVTQRGAGLAGLPPTAAIGTGSPRRRALLREMRPDLDVQAMRGNVDTRLRRVRDGDFDGVVLAAAGLRRLGREAEIAELLDPALFTPAVCQGILAIQTRADDQRSISIVRPLDDAGTRACAAAERAVAMAVGASCHTPVGAYARLSGADCEVTAFLADGWGNSRRSSVRGRIEGAAQLGAEVGSALLAAAGVHE
jgi:hydroxymethylbilane synthase